MTTPNRRRRLILTLACLAQFMVVLDISIVNVALPSIQRDLGLHQGALQWVVIAYGLLLGGFLLLGGRLGDLLGRRKIFLTGVTVFSVASLIAGLAQSAEVLIGARAVQGFGAALLAPSALAILAVTFPEGRERNGALGIFGAVAGSSASVGVIASGLLTDGPGWRWVFFVNVPVGMLLATLAFRFLPVDAVDTAARRYDAAGAGLVTSGLLALVYGLSRGVDAGWRSWSTLACFGGAVALLAAFAWVESRAKAPLVPGAALRNRTAMAANTIAFCLFGGFFSFIFLGSLLMQQQLGYSPTRTGAAWLATSLMAFLAAALAGSRLVPMLGVRRLLVAGMALLALSGAWLTRLPVDARYLPDLLPAFLLAGIAIGLSAPTVQIGALSRVTGAGVGLASGLVETMREIGGAVGIAAVSTVLAARADGVTAIADYRSALVVVTILAVLGVVIAGVAFPRTAPATQDETLGTADAFEAARAGD